ncbi:Nucleotide-binding protein 2 [Dermatophagoides farinae]|uniref:Cytosolic Fe-S cluster assembly factor NUBP2 homolog n=2 Tax=Dermatophagoides farinae TaxID=6954 RepID=A0A922L3S8_DERFA|nr:cytosolic fe-s cluster assembly factor nubp2-like [Dermatophagoides farinae]KAH9501993.1 Nucleotide-binding protein 2 [Dermatophagoides farinae]
MGIENVKHVLLVLSGKGGVGKSTVSCQLALSLQHRGYKVGILDIDICGPSTPRMLGLLGENVTQGSNGWIPIKYEKHDRPVLSVMSIGFLLNDQDAAVIWRGPRKTAMIRQFLTDVDWAELDFLIVDSPPGTSDEHISVVECLNNLPTKCQTNAILVTTPQSVAVGDVRREITFCHKGNVPILGLIENMSGYVCQHCSECSPIFSQGGGQTLAEYAQLDLLVTIPIETGLAECCDEGSDFIEKYPESETFKRFSELSNKICNKLCIQS